MVCRSVDAVLEWYAKMAPESEVREAAELARTILRQTWISCDNSQLET